MTTPLLSAVILAAGRSSRLGRPKQLLDLGGQPVITHVVDRALAAPLDEVILVLGYEAAAIERALDRRLQQLRAIVNPEFAAGQSTSLIAGIRAVAPESDGALVLLGDQPQVTSALISTLVTTFRASRPTLVLPAYGPERIVGNPVILSRSLFPEVLNVTGDQGARQVIRRQRDDAIVVDFPELQPPQDIDTEADYAAVSATWSIK